MATVTEVHHVHRCVLPRWWQRHKLRIRPGDSTRCAACGRWWKWSCNEFGCSWWPLRDSADPDPVAVA